MSCFIMSTNSLAILADTIESILNCGCNGFGFNAPNSLYKELFVCRDNYGYFRSLFIFEHLYALNVSAYNGRYKNYSEIEIPQMPIIRPLMEKRQYKNGHGLILPWHYQFCKMLDCFIYQCSEDATKNDPLLLALIDFSYVYKSFLAENTDEYNDALWG